MSAPALTRRTVPVNVGGGDQVVGLPGAIGIYIGGGSGGLVCRLVGMNTDTTFAGLVTGQVYPFQIATIRQTGTTITNSLILIG